MCFHHSAITCMEVVSGLATGSWAWSLATGRLTTCTGSLAASGLATCRLATCCGWTTCCSGSTDSNIHCVIIGIITHVRLGNHRHCNIFQDQIIMHIQREGDGEWDSEIEEKGGYCMLQVVVLKWGLVVLLAEKGEIVQVSWNSLVHTNLHYLEMFALSQ